MKFIIKGKWSNGFSNDGLLYFAQRIEEMLMHYTSHIYKVPVTNTYILILEYLKTIELVEKKIINEAHLKAISEEFLITFKDDIVLKHVYGETWIKQIVDCYNSSSKMDQQRLMNYLSHKLTDYSSLCVDYLLEIVPKEKEKKKIERALKCYVPLLIYYGYSQDFLFHYCRSFFRNYQISSIDCLKEFLSRFDFNDEKYIVYMVVPKKTYQFKTILENRLSVITFIDKIDLAYEFNYDDDKYCLVKIEVESLDEYSAVIEANEILKLFFEYYQFIGNRNDDWKGEKVLVVDKNEKCTVLNANVEQYFYSQDYDDFTVGKISEKVITILLSRTNVEEFFNIDSVLVMHNKAVSCHDIDNAFLNLWSILEVIGVKDKTESKISEIGKTILPALKKDYITNIFTEVHDYLKANLGEKIYNNLIGQVKQTGSDYYRLACLIINNEYDEVRQSLYNELKKYPLIRTRIANLHDVFSHKKGFGHELQKYTQRVSWHLIRLYRTRNAIIHSGRSPKEIVSLGEHLHSYVDAVLFEVILRMVREGKIKTIDGSLMDLRLEMEYLEQVLNSDNKFCEEEIQMLVADIRNF